MQGLGLVIQLVGLLIAVVGSIWLIVVAFQESVLWGLGCLFVPCVGLIFAVTHWDKASKPFLIGLVGGVISMVGGVLAKGGIEGVH